MLEKLIHELSNEYNNAKKDVIKEDNKKLSLINNAKWFMIAHIISFLNKDNKDDFSSFDYKLKKESLPKIINEYFDQASALTVEEITIDEFKNNTWYDKMKKGIDMTKVCKLITDEE